MRQARWFLHPVSFISNFTHELKTPLTSLKLYLETFRKHELSRENQLKYIGYMVQDADRLSDSISRILSLAKIESRVYEDRFVEEDLVGVVERFYEKNRDLFARCKVTIHNPAGKTFNYPIHLVLFEMLLMNLFTNAIKYNEAEVPRLDIRFEPRGRGLHVRYLMDRSDFVFLPFYLEQKVAGKGVRRQYCYCTQFAPSLTSASLTPLVHSLHGALHTKLQLHSISCNRANMNPV